MVLAVVEYDFYIEYFPGVQNVLADFGSRQLDADDAHDTGEDFSLEDLFTSAAFDVVTDLPKKSKSDYSVEDFDELQHCALQVDTQR